MQKHFYGETMEDSLPEAEVKTFNLGQFNLPLRRFFARLIDTTLGFVIIQLILVFSSLNSKEDENIFYVFHEIFEGQEFFMVSLLLYVFIESILLATWGRTFGKWVLGVKIISNKGKISYLDALNRSFQVYMHGLVFGIYYVWVLGLWFSFDRLRKKGITTWDEKGGFSLECEKLQWWKPLVAIMVFYFLFFKGGGY